MSSELPKAGSRVLPDLLGRCGLNLEHLDLLFRPEHRVIVGREIMMTLVCLLNLSDVFAMPVERIAFCVYCNS